MFAKWFTIYSVVTSISVVHDDDPPEKKQKYKDEYEKYSVEHTGKRNMPQINRANSCIK